mmetsp:Transcript_47120/g.131486  ORF Transcript_47120/g.131486 Transcript_47120/m.131486 type:complete len:208 (+) Transcript_47120:358-981(+)
MAGAKHWLFGCWSGEWHARGAHPWLRCLLRHVPPDASGTGSSRPPGLCGRPPWLRQVSQGPRRGVQHRALAGADHGLLQGLRGRQAFFSRREQPRLARCHVRCCKRLGPGPHPRPRHRASELRCRHELEVFGYKCLAASSSAAVVRSHLRPVRRAPLFQAVRVLLLRFFGVQGKRDSGAQEYLRQPVRSGCRARGWDSCAGCGRRRP